MPPSLLIAFVLASLYGLAFYIAFGKGWAHLGMYWLAGLIGFAIGQWLSGLVGIAFFNIGSVNLLEATLVSWLSLFAVRAWRRRAVP